MYRCLVCICLCLLVCLMPAESRRGRWSAWDWSYKQLRAATWVPGIKSWSSVSKGRAIFSAHTVIFKRNNSSIDCYTVPNASHSLSHRTGTRAGASFRRRENESLKLSKLSEASWVAELGIPFLTSSTFPHRPQRH